MTALNKKYVSDLFIDVTEANSTDTLWDLLVKFCKDHDLLHGRISIYDLDVKIGPDAWLLKRTYPEGPDSWGEYYISKSLHDHDRSFHLIFEQEVEHLEWQEMDRLTRQGTEANRVFVEMRNFGIGNGLLIGSSSLITHKTSLIGIAGPSRSFKDFKKGHYQALIHCLHTLNQRYVALAIKDKLLVPQTRPPINLSDRATEIVKLMSLDYDSAQIAEKLNISENGLNQALKRLRKATGKKTRAGIVAEALRAGRIQ